MFGLFDWLKLWAGALVGGVLAYQVGHWRGDDAGYDRAVAQNREATLDQIMERIETDESVADMDRAGLCGLLGGVWIDGHCT